METTATPAQTKRERTEQLVTDIKNLPSIPKVLFEVTKQLNDPQTAANRLSEIILKDQGLTAKLLSVANSPLYGLKRQISSVEYAVLILGLREVKNIVTALSLAETLLVPPGKNFDTNEFWKHSMVVGAASKAVATDLGFDFGSDVFVAGVLHDAGIQLIYRFLKSDFEKIIEISRAENKTILQAEEDVLGMTHQEIGFILAAKWGLPPVLCDALKYHHNPIKAESNEFFCSVIHLADYMTQRLEVGGFYWDKGLSFDPAVLELLNFRTQEALDEFIMEYQCMFKSTFDIIKI